MKFPITSLLHKEGAEKMGAFGHLALTLFPNQEASAKVRAHSGGSTVISVAYIKVANDVAPAVCTHMRALVRKANAKQA